MSFSESPMIVQSNALTQGRYNFSLIEKRIVYLIIQYVRKSASVKAVEDNVIDSENSAEKLMEGINQIVWDNLTIKIPLEAIKKMDSRLEDVHKAMKSLRQKSVTINNGGKLLEVGFINYSEHDRDCVEVEVSRKILPYIAVLASQFTSYYLFVAISMKNKYSQRFYEYCSQYKSVGFFTLTVEELREKFGIVDKYSRYALLRQNVIETARKELQLSFESKTSDLCFSYKEKRKGRSVVSIDFYVKNASSEEQEKKLSFDDYLFYVTSWLRSWFNVDRVKRNHQWVSSVVLLLKQNPDLLEKCYDKMVWTQKHKPSADWARYIRSIIDREFVKKDSTNN